MPNGRPDDAYRPLAMSDCNGKLSAPASRGPSELQGAAVKGSFPTVKARCTRKPENSPKRGTGARMPAPVRAHSPAKVPKQALRAGSWQVGRHASGKTDLVHGG